MEKTPERPSLDCVSSIKSSSNQNISDIPFFNDSPEIQKSREEGFSSSILINLAEEKNRPASKLINLTEIRPGQNPRKLLLPLFYQEYTESHTNSNFSLRRVRRSLSLDSTTPHVYSKNKPNEEKKTITTTTINTQSNFDMIEINPEFFQDKIQYDYEREIKNSGVNFEIPEFTINPTMIHCNNCGGKNLTVVERERSRGKFFEKIVKAICCCINGFMTGNETYTHRCSVCSFVLYQLNA